MKWLTDTLLYVLGFALLAPALSVCLGVALDGVLFVRLPFSVPLRMTLGILAVVGGIFWIAKASNWLRIYGSGLPVSSIPTSSIVEMGPYRWSRHPIYLGAIILVAGLGLAAGSFWTLVMGAPLLAFFYGSYACGIEEPELARRFGGKYEEFRTHRPLLLGFPGRRKLISWFARLLAVVSQVVNRPRLAYFGEHIFFWGYGVWPGIGVAIGLGIFEWLLIVQGVLAQSMPSVIALTALAGLLGTGLTWQVGDWLAGRRVIDQGRTKVGFVSWGALLGILCVAPVVAKLTSLSMSLFLDASLASLMVVHVFGRIGCTFFGCCYGKESSSSISLTYRHEHLKATREGSTNGKLIPVQLMSAIYGAIIASLVFGIWFTSTIPRGVPSGLSMALYGCFRVCEECLRTHVQRCGIFESRAQVAALLLAFVGLLVLFGVGDGSVLGVYEPLRTKDLIAGAAKIHLALVVGVGCVTTFVFSYHFRQIGYWS